MLAELDEAGNQAKTYTLSNEYAGHVSELNNSLTSENKDGAENSSGSIYSNEKIVPPKQVNGGRFGVQVPPAKYIGDKPVVGSHNATVKVINSNGKITNVWRENGVTKQAIWKKNKKIKK